MEVTVTSMFVAIDVIQEKIHILISCFVTSEMKLQLSSWNILFLIFFLILGKYYIQELQFLKSVQNTECITLA